MYNPANPWPVGGEDVAYGHATGRLRALESRLLTATELEAAVRQGQQLSWSQLLDQLDYPEGNDLFERIADARQQADDLLVALGVDKPLTYGLLLSQTYHNLKVFLKSLLPSGVLSQTTGMRSLETIPEALSDLLFWGSYDKPQALWALVVSVASGEAIIPELPPQWQAWTDEQIGLDELGPYAVIRTHLPPVLSAAVHAACQSYARSGEVGTIDATLDYYAYAHLAALAERANLPFLKTYSQLKADLANLNALYRIEQMGLSDDQAKQFWVPGGQLRDETAFVQLRHQTRLDWVHAFDETKVSDLAGLAYDLAKGQASEEDRKPGVFARRADNLIMDLAQTGRQVIYGPQAVAGYWLARQTEAQNLRMLLSLQAQNERPEQCLSLLREVYIHG